MKKLILTLLTALGLAGGVHAAGGGLIALDKASVDVSNQASLQNGAKLFVNYCLGCHSAASMLQPSQGHWSDRSTDQGQPAVHHR